MILRVSQRRFRQAIRFQSPIDVAVERQASRLRAVAPALKIEGLEPFVVHGREIIADMHQAFEIVCGLLFGYDREFFRIVAQTWFRNRNTDLDRVHV